MWAVVLFTLLAGAAGGVWQFRVRQARKTAVAAAVRTAKAVRGAVRNAVRLAGSITATRYADIVAPRLQAPDHGNGLVLLFVPATGDQVKEGQLVAELDGTSAKDHLDDVEAQVAQGEMDLLRVKANQSAEAETYRQRARAALGAMEKAQQDIRASATKNRIDQELLKLALEEARENYAQAEKQLAIVAEQHAAAMRVAELDQERQVRHRNRHRHDMEILRIKAPMNGRVIMRPIFRNGEQGQVRVGDELHAGQAFMRVVDISAMQLETSMNQAESELVRVGQRAAIRFDAYPEIQLQGKVVSVGTIATSGRRVNYFIRRVPVRISLDGTDPRVLPDLTASADVVIAEDDSGLVVPREAVREEDGKPVVYVKQAGTFAAREIEIGLAGNTEISVRSGLQAGDEVALDRP